jgi:hypothetical protein
MALTIVNVEAIGVGAIEVGAIGARLRAAQRQMPTRFRSSR